MKKDLEPTYGAYDTLELYPDDSVRVMCRHCGTHNIVGESGLRNSVWREATRCVHCMLPGPGRPRGSRTRRKKAVPDASTPELVKALLRKARGE